MRTSFNIPDDLLSQFDHVWEHQGLDSRSRAVREAMSEYIASHTTLETAAGTVTTVIAFDYDHDIAMDDVHAAQREYRDVIVSSNHVHESDRCTETVTCRGEVDRIRSLVYRLRDFDAVGRVKPVITRSMEDDCHHRV